MSFPWLFEENFELGTRGGFDSETDTVSQLDFPHYTELARVPWPDYAPFRGAFVARWRLTGGTADAFLTEGDVNIAADGTAGIRFPFYVSPDFAATADDTFTILELHATGVIELSVGFRITAATDVIEMGIGELAPTVFLTPPIQKGRWYQAEVYGDLDSGVGNDGSFTLNVEGATATISALDQGAITDALVGVQDHLATTTGTILMDQIVFDTEAAGTPSRIYPLVDRYPRTVTLTQRSHAFVGPGQIQSLQLSAGAGTDNVVTIFDTDRGNTNSEAKYVGRLTNTANSQTVELLSGPVAVIRGAFIQMTGTNPRATVTIGQAVAYGSGGAVKGYGLRATLTPLEVL